MDVAFTFPLAARLLYRSDLEHVPLGNGSTVVSCQLNVIKGVKQTNQIVGFGRSLHLLGLQIILVRIYLVSYRLKYNGSVLSIFFNVTSLSDLQYLEKSIILNC